MPSTCLHIRHEHYFMVVFTILDGFELVQLMSRAYRDVNAATQRRPRLTDQDDNHTTMTLPKADRVLYSLSLNTRIAVGTLPNRWDNLGRTLDDFAPKIPEHLRSYDKAACV